MDFAAARRNMVASQIRTIPVTDTLVIAAIEAVPREKFVPAAMREVAYVDGSIQVGRGRYLMEPAVLARLLQLADLEPNDKALVVASGTGYTAAVLANAVVKVVSVESDATLSAQARGTCSEINAAVKAVVGDVKRGAPDEGAFDVIIIDGAVEEIPEAILSQLADGGRLVAVVRNGSVGRATLVVRSGAAFSRREDFDAMTPVLPEFTRAPAFVF